MEASSKQFNFSVLASFLTHGAIVLILALLINQNIEVGDHGSTTIQVDTVSPAKHKYSKNENSRAASHAQPSTRSQNRISLSDLGLKLNHTPLPPVNEESESSPPAASDDGGWDTLNPDPRIARFNQYVYNTVQGWLDRDAYLNHQRLTGTVKVKIWFDKDGNFLEDETVYEAIDPDFKKIVERALKKSFANPIPHPFLYRHEKFSIERIVVIRDHFL